MGPHPHGCTAIDPEFHIQYFLVANLLGRDSEKLFSRIDELEGL
jgi:hypothetical protein